jgi:hypothetical protein
MRDWLDSPQATRVWRTLVQVFGGVFIAAVVDFGMDGAIAWRDYVFGQSGVIVIGAGALAVWMNRTVPPQ